MPAGSGDRLSRPRHIDFASRMSRSPKFRVCIQVFISCCARSRTPVTEPVPDPVWPHQMHPIVGDSLSTRKVPRSSALCFRGGQRLSRRRQPIRRRTGGYKREFGAPMNLKFSLGVRAIALLFAPVDAGMRSNPGEEMFRQWRSCFILGHVSTPEGWGGRGPFHRFGVDRFPNVQTWKYA